MSKACLAAANARIAMNQPRKRIARQRITNSNVSVSGARIRTAGLRGKSGGGDRPARRLTVRGSTSERPEAERLERRARCSAVLQRAVPGQRVRSTHDDWKQGWGGASMVWQGAASRAA